MNIIAELNYHNILYIFQAQRSKAGPQVIINPRKISFKYVHRKLLYRRWEQQPEENLKICLIIVVFQIQGRK